MSWMLLPSNVFLLLSKGRIVNHKELINSNVNKQILKNKLIKEQLPWILLLNTTLRSVSKGSQEGSCGSCVQNDLFSFSISGRINFTNWTSWIHMLLFISKSSWVISVIMRRYKLTWRYLKTGLWKLPLLLGSLDRNQSPVRPTFFIHLFCWCKWV